jgi:hypothetical protein
LLIGEKRKKPRQHKQRGTKIAAALERVGQMNEQKSYVYHPENLDKGAYAPVSA